MKTRLMSFFLVLGTFLASAQAQNRTAQAESLVTRACSSTKPVLVIDTFEDNATNEINIDIDGDGFYDVHHGDFVSRLIELNGQSVTKVTVGTPVFSHQLLETLLVYIEKIESGSLGVSWINFSQGFTVEIESLNRLLGLSNVIHNDNVHDYASAVLEKLWTDRPKLKVKELYLAFLRLEELGVPVFIAAANSGFKEVNIYSLFPNVYSVGALDGEKKASYSADNSAVTLWRQGTVKSYAVSNGIDLNQDGIADYLRPPFLLSQELIATYADQKASPLVSAIPAEIDRENDNNKATFFELFKKLPAGLYRTSDVLFRSLSTPYQQNRYLMNLGDLFYTDGVHSTPLFFARTDTSGYIRVSQGLEENGRQFRNNIYGTSFASPNICSGERTPDDYAL